MTYNYCAYAREWSKESASLVIDTRPLEKTRYSSRYNKVETEEGVEYTPLILIQCGPRTSRAEGEALAQKICNLLNKAE